MYEPAVKSAKSIEPLPFSIAISLGTLLIVTITIPVALSSIVISAVASSPNLMSWTVTVKTGFAFATLNLIPSTSADIKLLSPE